jgi:hypothetical protein
LNSARTVSEIVNADISATAAIAGSKIAPTFTTQVTVPNGTAASPGIRITNEQTGLFRASTGLGIAASGEAIANFGVPSASSYGGLFVLNSGSSNELALACTNLAAAGMAISGSTGISAGGQIRVYGNSHATKPNFVELTSGNTVRMTVDNLGNFGIGGAPSCRLEVLDVGTSNGEYFRAGTIATDRSLRFSSFLVGGTNGVGHDIHAPHSSGTLSFSTNSAERMRIDASGNVGINDASPSYRLDVNGDANLTGVLRVAATQVVTNRITGWGAPSGTISRAAFTIVANATYSQAQFDAVIQALKAVITDLRTHGLIGA